jgi:hypothetical protein
MVEVRWKSRPDEHDYPAAANFLELLTDPLNASYITQEMHGFGIGHFKAKDILRASRLPLLPEDNKHVKADLRKIEDGEKLSPILLIRGDLFRGTAAVIADGYHRVCASYWVDENVDIPCQIVTLAR